MPKNKSKKLVVAISSRALFNLDQCHQIYKKEGIESYKKYQLSTEHEILEPGPAFHLVEKFLKLNQGKKESEHLVEVILLSRNSADTGLRVFHSIEHYGLDITRAAFQEERVLMFMHKHLRQISFCLCMQKMLKKQFNLVVLQLISIMRRTTKKISLV